MRSFIATIAVVSALFCAGLATSAFAKPHEHKPPKGAKGALQGELPHIKGIAPEIFANASEQAQIKALQIESDSKESLHKATQNLLEQIFQNEQALSKNNLNERELRDKEEAQRIERIYTELRK